MKFLLSLAKLFCDNAQLGLKFFAPSILLKVHPVVRIRDIQRLGTRDQTNTVTQGALTEFKSKKQHGYPFPGAAVFGGFTGRCTWRRPIMNFRTAYYKDMLVYPNFAVPIINDEWEVDDFSPSNYNAARRRLFLPACSLTPRGVNRIHFSLAGITSLHVALNYARNLEIGPNCAIEPR